jgi:hypothetical protein
MAARGLKATAFLGWLQATRQAAAKETARRAAVRHRYGACTGVSVSAALCCTWRRQCLTLQAPLLPAEAGTLHAKACEAAWWLLLCLQA